MMNFGARRGTSRTEAMTTRRTSAAAREGSLRTAEPGGRTDVADLPAPGAPARPTVVVADDHDLFRAGIRTLLETASFVVCAEASDADEAVSAALEHAPDICLLDIGMPGDGIAAARKINDQLPATAIVMMTGSDAEEHVFAALRAGASGYLLKSMNPARLPAALRGVLAGEAALPRRLAARLIDEFWSSGRSRRVRIEDDVVELTRREWEVLRLLQDRASTADVAGRLGISPVTARRHISGTMQKLGVRTREEAVAVIAGRSDD